MLTYKIEKFSDVAVDMIPLWKAHWEEIAADQNKIPLAPDIKKYLELQDRDNLLTVVVRSDEKIVGYCIMFVTTHMHYKTTVFATNDVIYLSPPYRKGVAGIRLIKKTEEFLKERGVHKVLWHVKPDHNFGPILKRMGYSLAEYAFGKYIGE